MNRPQVFTVQIGRDYGESRMRQRHEAGFTLVEVLTVIGIIAILTAILFPVFSRAREQARQTSCISNLHEIYVKTNLYHNDFDAYPPLLLGLPENPDGSAWQPGSGTPVPMDKIRSGYLYPAYARSIDSFICPDSRITDRAQIVNGVFPANAGFSGDATYATHGIASATPSEPLPYYAADSYDLTPVSAGYQVTYSRDWTNAEGLGIDTRTDHPNQLKYPNPPADKTVLTWCNAHAHDSNDRCPVVFLSGTAKPMKAGDVRVKTWNLAGL